MFFFDDNAFVEPPGFWTRGASVAEIFVDAPGSPTPAALRLRAGPVPSAIVLSSGEWRQSVSLQPGESTVVTLPEGRPDGWPLTLETTSAFRPAQHDAGNTDMRNLGVWVEAAP